MSGKSIAPAVKQQVLCKGYPAVSWYALLSGMGIFPDSDALRAPRAGETLYNLAEIDNLLERSSVNYRKHREVLEDIPPRRPNPALQVYFW